MKKTMGIGEAVRLLGITVKTLQRSQREGRLVPSVRAANNRRCYAHCFPSRLYGLRDYRRQLRAAVERDHVAGTPNQD
jgi:predicted site-specific integrase-resolvase